jgi:hypothetical protein
MRKKEREGIPQKRRRAPVKKTLFLHPISRL